MAGFDVEVAGGRGPPLRLAVLPVCRHDRDASMKSRRYWFMGFCIFAVLGGIGYGWLWFYFMKPAREHEANIQNATTVMSSYGKAEWQELYDECLLLNQPKPVWNQSDRKTWPRRFAELNPVYLQAGRNECVTLGFTGGFDDFGLYVTIYLADTKDEGGPGYPAIRVFDDRGILSKSLSHQQCGSEVICRATSSEGEPAFVFRCVD